MTKLFSLYLTSEICFSSMVFAQSHQKILKLSLTNPTPLSRNSEIIEIPKHKIKKISEKEFAIFNTSSHQELTYQQLSNGNLLIQTDFKPYEKLSISFKNQKPSAFPYKVYGRFVPERYDDFAWENNKIAFRMYGKSLEKVPSQNAWGMDVWSKRTPEMIIDKWYQLNNYHQDHGEGLDFFHVGKSLGAGDVLPYVNQHFLYLGNYASYKIIEKGPLRFSFKLTYPEVQKEGISISATKVISLDADSQLNKINVQYSFSGIQRLPVFAGIVHWDGNGDKYIDNTQQWASYWPKSSQNGTVGTAIYFPKGKTQITSTQQHLGDITLLSPHQNLEFYTGAAWDKALEIKNAKEWQLYLENKIYKIQHPIRIK